MKQKLVNYLKTFLGLLWTLVFILLGIYCFMNSNSLVDNLFVRNKVRVSPNFTGGEVIAVHTFSDYSINVHEPVPIGPTGFQDKSFVQVDWIFPGKREPVQNQTVSIFPPDDDFSISIDPVTSQINFTPFNKRIINLMDKASMADFVFKGYKDSRRGLFLTDYGFSIRVIVKNE